MGQTSRILFVMIPFVLTWGTLIGLLLTFTGETGNNSVSQMFWFFGINTQGFEGLDDYYKVGLWNYCSGSFNQSQLHPQFCSRPIGGGYFFDASGIWNISTEISSQYSTEYDDTFSALQKLATFNFAAYVIAIVATSLTLPIAIFAFQRRLGSLLALGTATISMVFTVSASAGAIAYYTVLINYVNVELGQYGFSAYRGHAALAATAIASATSIGAFFFWAFTACCCRGRVAGHDAGSRAFSGDAYVPLQRGDPAFPMQHQTGYHPQTGYQQTPYSDEDEERYAGAGSIGAAPVSDYAPSSYSGGSMQSFGEVKTPSSVHPLLRDESDNASSVYSRYEPVRS